MGIQLLVDKIAAMPCGPCIHTEQRKKKCSQTRCEREKCVLSVINIGKGCTRSADGKGIKSFLELRWVTFQRCRAECEKREGCLAMDYSDDYREKRKSEKINMCRLFRKACQWPMVPGFASYR